MGNQAFVDNLGAIHIERIRFGEGGREFSLFVCYNAYGRKLDLKNFQKVF